MSLVVVCFSCSVIRGGIAGASRARARPDASRTQDAHTSDLRPALFISFFCCSSQRINTLYVVVQRKHSTADSCVLERVRTRRGSR